MELVITLPSHTNQLMFSNLLRSISEALVIPPAEITTYVKQVPAAPTPLRNSANKRVMGRIGNITNVVQFPSQVAE